MSEQQTNASEEVIDVQTKPEVDPKDIYFLINGEQINKCLAILGKMPYEQVFSLIDIFRVLKRVDVKFNDEQ